MRDRWSVRRALQENLSGLALTPVEARRWRITIAEEPAPAQRPFAAWLVGAALAALMSLMPVGAAGACLPG